MPMAYSLDQMNCLVRTRAWGSVTNADLHGYYHGLAADPRFGRDFRELVDLSAVLHFVVESTLIREVASWTVFRAGARRAFIAITDLAFGLSRMFSAYAEDAGQHIEVFRDAGAAERWLEQSEGCSPGHPPARAA
ncbi:MAG TPA: hypothetical protein VGP25_00440 [Gemmatimonadaceae bacterium]|jgi:hypothetical protein|nr:hypothetical protein [Gemmatimonadaceae bacterium]